MFTKAGLPTLVFSRDVLLPYRRPVTYHRRRRVSGGGVVRIVKIGKADRFIAFRLAQLLHADYDALSAWFDHPTIAEGAESFTYTDSVGVSQGVYWWEDTFDMPQREGDYYDVELMLRLAA